MEINAPTMPMDPMGMDLVSLAGQAKNKDGKAIDKVAKGFESMFASMMLKQMRQTLEAGSMFSGDKSDVMGGLFDFYMGQHMSQGPGLGIAAMVKKQLTQTQTRKP